MKNLVGVGIADAAEEVGVGKRSFEGVVLAYQRFLERRLVAVSHFQSPWIVVGKPRP